MVLHINYEEGQTPLDEQENNGLRLKTITTQGELNELEQRNIEEAVRWTIQKVKRSSGVEVVSEDFVRALHRQMLAGVWTWAGQFRDSEKNIGVLPHQISISLRMLIDDCLFWIKNKTYPPDEIAIRFKHRIVSIHCFSNGNGRHSRLMADVIIEKVFSLEVFSWGGQELANGSESRARYLTALQSADQGDYEQLLLFSRS